MARRSRTPSSPSKASAHGRGRRGFLSPIANRPILRLSNLSPIRVSPPRIATPVADRRRFYPDTLVMRREHRRPHIPASPRISDRRLVIDPFGPLKQTVRFAVPKRIALCIRRKVRKEVILATGSGGGRHRKPRRNEFSDVRC